MKEMEVLVLLENNNTNEIKEIEIWKDCVGYENKYEVSNLGRVKSKPYVYINPTNGKRRFYRGKIKKQCETSKREKSKQGYLCTRMMSCEGISKSELVHILVAKAFIPNPKNLPTVNHIDGNKHNNKVENLEWATFSYNNQHAYDNSLKSDNQMLIRTNCDGIIENIYVSEADAQRKTGIYASFIRRCCDEEISDYYGYYWYRFENNKYHINIT